MRHPAFLLAAGFGTRLRPLTLHRPKPLVPFMGRPLLDQAVALLQKHGIDRAVVNAHYLADAVAAWAEGHNQRGEVHLTVSREAPVILGTGGGLRKVMDQLDDPFVVVNGDILCDVDLGALRAAAPAGGAAMALRTLQGESYGVVAHDGQRVVDLVGLARAEPAAEVDRGTHFTGVHAMRRETLALVPPEGEACIVRTAYVKLVPDRAVAAVPHAGVWVDLGNPAAYLRAHLDALDEVYAPPLDTWPLAGVSIKAGGLSQGNPEGVQLGEGVKLRGPVWIGRNVSLGDGAQIGPRAVVGDGASIGAGAVVRDAVVWDGTAVSDGASCIQGVQHDGGWLSIGDVK